MNTERPTLEPTAKTSLLNDSADQPNPSTLDGVRKRSENPPTSSNGTRPSYVKTAKKPLFSLLPVTITSVYTQPPSAFTLDWRPVITWRSGIPAEAGGVRELTTSISARPPLELPVT
mmetsp:Transcript_6606/g.11791  ORF Transcript_6606/g.11791 Transcript_6606/m.11791 type:complete len:117 (+) Transcript_6606:274-624(+)